VLRLYADESLRGPIITQVRLRVPTADFTTADDELMRGTPDPDVLEWAAQRGRIVVASDRRTMIGYAYARLRAGQRMPGLFHVPSDLGIGPAVNDLVLMLEASEPEDWDGRVVHLPV
jgi:hypothetical protein